MNRIPCCLICKSNAYRFPTFDEKLIHCALIGRKYYPTTNHIHLKKKSNLDVIVYVAKREKALYQPIKYTEIVPTTQQKALIDCNAPKKDSVKVPTI